MPRGFKQGVWELSGEAVMMDGEKAQGDERQVTGGGVWRSRGEKQGRPRRPHVCPLRTGHQVTTGNPVPAWSGPQSQAHSGISGLGLATWD